MQKIRNQRGFTIIELMIATTVLSVVLLISALIISNIGNLYYKGVNSARIQNDARDVTEDVSQSLKLSNGGLTPVGPSPVYSAYCINTTSYTYVVGKQLGNDATKGQLPHVLWRDTVPSGTCQVSDFTHGEELIAPKSRLIKFSISPASPFQINIGIALGDNDLLCNPDNSGTCTSSTDTMTDADWAHGNLRCKGGAGNEFCATTNLSTIAVRRIIDN